MSIPRTAIERPVTMFMICGVIMLLGLMSLARLPVDLMPDVSYPSLTVRVGYPGVGPLEMEELVTRPIEQAVSATSGVERLESTSSEGSSRVTLNFAWGTDLNEAADDVRNRLDRVRGRLPEEAEAPVMFKFDANAQPIMGIGVEGNFDRVTLREIAENDLSPRLERVPGVASVSVEGGLRRQIHVELSKEKITALELPVNRIIQLLRSENQNVPLGEIDEGDRTYLLRSQGQFENLDQIRDLVVMTRTGVPVYLKDIAKVSDATEDFRSFTRINGNPGVRLRVTKQSGQNTVAIADAVRVEVARINNEIPGLRLQVLDDSSVFIKRSIASVQEAAVLGAGLVILIIFVFLRNIRSTLIICTSIPISIIGTFALLYFGGFTLNTLTFGGLALGVGMIVDAAIVVLENTFRHMEMGKSRMQASIEGSEEVWSAILASTLTHIAVFVPLLFLTRRVQHPLQAAGVRRHVLVVDVAVRGGDDRAGPLLAAVEAPGARRTAQGPQRPPVHHKRALAGSAGRFLHAGPALLARASADGSRRGHGSRRPGGVDPSDDWRRADAAGGRRRGQRHGGTAGRHAHRTRARCRAAAGVAAQRIRA